MNLLYPRFSPKLFLPMFGLACLGALIAGLYGMLHDQITYTICPEYFTHLKFLQFGYANFGFPPRIFVAEIGFLATWWVGFFAGWFLARIAVPAWPLKQAIAYVLRGFAVIFVTVALAGSIGAILGLLHDKNYLVWRQSFDFLTIFNQRAFVTVAYIHNAGYLGGLAGLVLALIVLARQRFRASLAPSPLS